MKIVFLANERTEVKEARSGDIVAIVGLKDTVTGDTLCDPNNAVILERMDFPSPVIKIAVEPKTKVSPHVLGLTVKALVIHTYSLTSTRPTRRRWVSLSIG